VHYIVVVKLTAKIDENGNGPAPKEQDVTSEEIFEAMRIIRDPIAVEQTYDNKPLGDVYIKHRGKKQFWLTLTHWTSVGKQSFDQIDRQLNDIGLTLSGWNIKKLEIHFYIRVIE